MVSCPESWWRWQIYYDVSSTSDGFQAEVVTHIFKHHCMRPFLKLHHLPRQKVELSQSTTKNDSRWQLMLRLWPRNSASTWLHRGMWSFLEKLVLPMGWKQIGKSSTSYSVRGHVLFRVKLEAWNPSRWLVNRCTEMDLPLIFSNLSKENTQSGGSWRLFWFHWQQMVGEGCSFLLLDGLRFFMTWCFGKQVMTFGKDVSREISSLKRW